MITTQKQCNVTESSKKQDRMKQEYPKQSVWKRLIHDIFHAEPHRNNNDSDK
ncbi:hypothetical protein NXG27_03840 [Megasphaera paucivorans]|uniref:Uncharacterized protein n=1 Tax=Megasphaera paucivorans TaxID=349095 RepID=A0A1G9QZN2_9FIRM|nr:hypothetical protein [Megasphaera paucivorans]SDM16469.1 hypothetical protein SAMN05660299_00342 [Megasphaera paucivorans]